MISVKVFIVTAASFSQECKEQEEKISTLRQIFEGDAELHIIRRCWKNRRLRVIFRRRRCGRGFGNKRSASCEGLVNEPIDNPLPSSLSSIEDESLFRIKQEKYYQANQPRKGSFIAIKISRVTS